MENLTLICLVEYRYVILSVIELFGGNAGLGVSS